MACRLKLTYIVQETPSPLSLVFHPSFSISLIPSIKLSCARTLPNWFVRNRAIIASNGYYDIFKRLTTDEFYLAKVQYWIWHKQCRKRWKQKQNHSSTNIRCFASSLWLFSQMIMNCRLCMDNKTPPRWKEKWEDTSKRSKATANIACWSYTEFGPYLQNSTSLPNKRI